MNKGELSHLFLLLVIVNLALINDNSNSMNKFRFRLVYSLGVLTCALPLALTSSPVSVGHSEGLFDYSNGTNVAYLKGGDLLKECGLSLDKSEVNYLNAKEEYQLAYSEAFNNDDVYTSRIGDSLFIFAHRKSYTDYNGREWTWTPKSVKVQNEYDLEPFDDFYVVEIENASSIVNVKVQYELSLDVSHQTINSFINKSYQDAVTLVNTKEKYESDLFDYNRRPLSEDEYQAQLEEYNTYLNKYDNYQSYLSDLAKYNADLETYEPNKNTMNI